MPRTRSLAFAELKIGILAVVALVIAASVIFLLTGTGGFFWQRYALKSRFPNVAGLKTGAPVRVAGVEVGTVKAIEFAGTSVDVTYEVSRDLRPTITDHSRASLGSLSLLGQSTVDLTASTTGRPVREWGYVPIAAASGQLSDVATSASAGLDEATRLLQDVRAGRGTVGRLFTDDALYRDLRGFVEAADQVATNLQRGRGTVGRLVSDPAVYQNLQQSVETLNGILQRVKAGEGSLGQLLADDRLARSVASATGHVDSLASKIDQGQGSAGRLVNDPALYERLSSTAGRLEQLTEKLSEGQGTAGQLLQDRQLYENMNGAASQLRQLVADIRQNPKKFLTVRLTFF
jgi:phospholipid/cholesterol/gamma-HCH transport system substrate-binding protein